jgi:hypothetical protein
MTSVKPFGILVGTQGEGWACKARYRRIADIARDRENPKLLPLIHTDDTDQQSGGPAAHRRGRRCHTGVVWVKPTPIWDDLR